MTATIKCNDCGRKTPWLCEGGRCVECGLRNDLKLAQATARIEKRARTDEALRFRMEIMGLRTILGTRDVEIARLTDELDKVRKPKPKG